MPTRIARLCLALACATSFAAQAAPREAAPAASAARAASTPSAGACPGRAASSPQDAGRASSKLRHMPDEGDPCASSFGLGRPLRPLAPASGPT